MEQPMQKQMPKQKQTFLVALAIAATTLLTACGPGGPGGPDGGGTAATTINPADLKGRWATPKEATTAMTAIIIPDAGTANVWLLANDSSRLVKLMVRGDDSSSNGKSYALSADGRAAGDGQPVVGKATLTATPKSVSFTGVNATVLALNQSDALAGPAVQADVAGSWDVSMSSGSRKVQWSLDAAGAIASTDSSSTTGCTYTGTLAAMTDAGAYKAQFSEACPDTGGTKTVNFSGIATINPEKSRLTVIATSADDARGAALLFKKK
ncbi:hypothetical protein D5041_13230 [Verminephrobacter aporrectodeae subsp. tuberculatae]|nr:hypothetical protein [Verminephrobacter aporrectodeae subsp. tuberculatae]